MGLSAVHSDREHRDVGFRSWAVDVSLRLCYDDGCVVCRNTKRGSMAIKFYSHRGTFGCFSNFSHHPIVIDEVTWPTSEHYFQAMKFPDDEEWQERIRAAPTPGEAKKIAWRAAATLRPDWDAYRDEVMLRALRAKFSQHLKIRRTLLDTGEEELIEHTPRDRYWGDGGDGSGENRLGQLLMQVRRELSSEQGETIDRETARSRAREHRKSSKRIQK